jgi:hypothetical protein
MKEEHHFVQTAKLLYIYKQVTLINWYSQILDTNNFKDRISQTNKYR